MKFWAGQRVVVTGGTGFLGSRLTAALQARGCAAVSGLGSGDDDLRRVEEAARLFRELQPTLVVHLAAVVGGIGANRERPAEFFFDNLTMGLHVIDQAWRAGVPKVVIAGTVCAYPKFAPAVEEGRERIEVWGDGSASREFLFVDDAVDGIMRAAEHYDGGEPVNLGSGREIRIRDLRASELQST